MDIAIKLLILMFGVLVGALFMGWYASVKRMIVEGKIDIMRICSEKQDDKISKQDDAIRKKEARIANLEKEIRRMRRKEG